VEAIFGKHRPGSQVTELLNAARYLALRIEGEIDAYDSVLVQKCETVVGRVRLPRDRHHLGPGGRWNSLVKVLVQKVSNCRYMRV
jgi:hypothetical protein